jgi:hypothetical protein
MSSDMIPQLSRIQQLEHWLIRCESCGYIDHTHRFGDFVSYGRALGRTCSGELAEFSTWDDPAYNELLELVRTIMGRNHPRLSDCFDKMMSLASDPSPLGERYDFTNKLCCRRCRANARWYKLAEPVIESVHLPLVTHQEWEGLGHDAKLEMLQTALRSQECIQ